MKTLSVIFLFISLTGFSQRWQDENRGLYPQSIQVTINARNSAVGLRYGYLFQKPLFGVPVGLYGSFSNTIKPDMRYNNYSWERKIAIGGMITLPYSREMQGIHTILTLGAVYNSHPSIKMDDPGLYQTSPWGCDIGVQLQKNRTTGHISIDVLNFMRYVELGIGITFYKLRR
jgi:hypothetical protein